MNFFFLHLINELEFVVMAQIGTRGSGSSGCSGGGSGGRSDCRRPRSSPLQIEAVAFGERHSGMSVLFIFLFLFLLFIFYWSLWLNSFFPLLMPVTGLFNSLTVCIINERQQHQFMSEHQSDS
jgi:hypothetical protein